jgi:hypothetical protein
MYQDKGYQISEPEEVVLLGRKRKGRISPPLGLPPTTPLATFGKDHQLS